MKKVIVVTALVVLVLFVVLCIINQYKSKRDLENILQDGRLTVLINSGEYGFTRDSAKVAGFQYQVIRNYTDQLGVELVIIQESDHREGNRELIRGECDVIVSLQPLIADSSSDVISLVPLVETNLMLVQLPDSLQELKVKKQYELDGKTITCTKASPFLPLLYTLADDLAIDPVLVESDFTSIDEVVSEVASGKIEFAVCPRHLASRIKTKYPQVDMSLPLTFHLNLGWTVRRSSVKLQESLNEFLTNFTGTAEYWSLYSSYFSATN